MSQGQHQNPLTSLRMKKPEGHSHSDISPAKKHAWTPNVESLLRRWGEQVSRRRIQHIKLANTYSRRHYLVGIPAAVLSALVGTSIYSYLENSGSVTAQYILGTVAMISAILSVVQTFMGYQTSSQQHKSAADAYESLYRVIDIILRLDRSERDDPVKVVEDIRTTFDEIVKSYPPLQSEENSLSLSDDDLPPPLPSTIPDITPLQKLMEEPSEISASRPILPPDINLDIHG